MQFKYGSLLSTAFSAAMIVASAVATPSDAHILETPTPAVQPIKESFQNAQLKECALERRRWLYEARSNTLIETNIAVISHQEVAMGRKLEI